jgi:hypothetical protein
VAPHRLASAVGGHAHPFAARTAFKSLRTLFIGLTDPPIARTTRSAPLASSLVQSEQPERILHATERRFGLGGWFATRFEARDQLSLSSNLGFHNEQATYTIRGHRPDHRRETCGSSPTATPHSVKILSRRRMGDKLDETKGQELKAGGFVEAPAKMNHYAWTTSETVVQVHGQGPFAITYVNPADDPSKKQ